MQQRWVLPTTLPDEARTFLPPNLAAGDHPREPLLKERKPFGQKITDERMFGRSVIDFFHLLKLCFRKVGPNGVRVLCNDFLINRLGLVVLSESRVAFRDVVI